MLTEGAWRKLPKDLLVDEDFAYVESLVPKEYAYAPYMFFIAALRKADDNGIFDVEDFVIFARLMRVPDIEIVKTIVNGLIKRRIIYREGESTLCGFWMWEHGEDKKVRPLSERRALVREMIKNKENERKSTQFATGSTRPEQTKQAEKCNDTPQKAPETNLKNYITPAQDSISFCPQNDKNGENVTKKIDGDKIGENVTKKNETEREKERKIDKSIQEEKERTHTLEQRTERKTEKEELTGSGQLVSPPPVNSEQTEAVAEDLTEKEVSEIEKENDSQLCNNVESLAEEALNTAQENDEETKKLVDKKLTRFFVKNCYGYDAKQGAHSIRKLVQMIMNISDKINPADTVADILCNEFKHLSETGGPNGYWKDIPLLPSNMCKNNVWAYLMSYAGKILAAKEASNKFFQEEQKALEEAKKECAAVGDVIEAEYLKYNIKIDDPQKALKLIRAKAAEQHQKKENVETVDIF